MADDERATTTARQFLLLGGSLCLDFANTADWHAGDAPVEMLTGYATLLDWGQATGILDARQAARLAREAVDDPQAAEEALRRAIALRETIYRLFSRIAAGNDPERADLAELNAALAESLPHRRIARRASDYRWDWREGGLDRVIWPVALSAAELLVSSDRDRVRECAGHPCGWLFIDTSRNRSRRWCSMEICGNRAKARRHYQRARASSGVRAR